MNDQFSEIQDMLVGMVTNVASGAIEFLPKLIGALAVLFLGWILAKILRAVLARSIQVSLDALLERSGLMEALERASISAQPSQIMGGAAYWLTLILFVMGAAEIVALTAGTSAITDLGIHPEPCWRRRSCRLRVYSWRVSSATSSSPPLRQRGSPTPRGSAQSPRPASS